MGRKPSLKEAQRTEVRQRLADGDDAAHLAQLFGVSRAIICRTLLRQNG